MLNPAPAGGRLLRRALLGAVRLHAGRHHFGAQLRHHARHAPQQAAQPQARIIHHDVRVVLRHPHGECGVQELDEHAIN